MVVHEFEPFDLEFCSSEPVSRLGHAWKLQYPGLQVLEDFVPVDHDSLLPLVNWMHVFVDQHLPSIGHFIEVV